MGVLLPVRAATSGVEDTIPPMYAKTLDLRWSHKVPRGDWAARGPVAGALPAIDTLAPSFTVVKKFIMVEPASVFRARQLGPNAPRDDTKRRGP